ncbi:disease resistance protein RML1A isoform X4 [Arabidopsis lyrata subsp. lyrata]|uniref:disease resistance protein RML1A isoform X4 n=1 Tax=Arabidopsis lyrata subsp. lyrata TaxID=81972 RepID=UPI000A29D614|nr:disease resistance protein RML1A isoform X4 [Arabidopsis lyrata subsp. lyrata]|eukprot:XP_020872252.1 disease resistance protein RML1A isoform X4 [Arabidopsis lyrata subsp. lyrata]
MASSSSSSGIMRYHVFPSFHGPDVRRGFLSHLHDHFASKGITTFKDQEIERGHTIKPELVQAIRESRVSIVLLSKKYASSSWCLDELVEIFKCKEDQGQIVMTIFYDVDPSSVRKQKGDFGTAFMKTCEGKSEETKQSWSNALTHAANIEGEHSLNWANEADMIKKIATDVSNKLNLTPSKDFDGMVGHEAHLAKLNSLLCLESDEVKMIGIWGPAGIGKSTIARALDNQLSSNFQLKCFMGNLKGSLKSRMGVDDHDSKLWLQNQLLSKIFNQENMKMRHLGAIKERLQRQRVLIILDDVDDLEQLEVLAKEPSWFGSGSRIIVTTEDKKILEAHGIKDIYHVDFPSEEEALEILCLSAFKQSSVPNGFEEVANKVAELCGNLPLGLCVVGSSLRGQSKQEWELQLSRIDGSLDGKVEDILKVGFDSLSKKNQSLFLHIACFFNNEVVDNVISVLSDSNLDVRNGLETLADKSLVHKSTYGRIVMHHLLQQLGRQIVHEQSDEPGKRQFLFEADEICDVLSTETGTGSVIGISFDTSNIGEVSVSKGAFEGMRNLRFLRIFRRWFGGEGTLQIPEDLDYLPLLRLLHWEFYPRTSLPRRFQPERLMELRMPFSNLEKLWGGIQSLPNLKIIDLMFSRQLKEIPNLSNATNLEELTLEGCGSLVELPSSIKNLQKLKILDVGFCCMLQVIPSNINLASLKILTMNGCSRLRTFPEISSNIKVLNLGDTDIEDVPPSVAGCLSRLDRLNICSSSLKRLTHVPLFITDLILNGSDIETIPDCVIGLTRLEWLSVKRCTKLESIPGLPPSLKVLDANDCVSLKRVRFSFHTPTNVLQFSNCLKLDKESRRGIIQKSIYDYVCLPGKKIPAEFTHKATGRSITIPLAPGTLSASSRFKACLLISPVKDYGYEGVSCTIRSKGGVTVHRCECPHLSLSFRSEHLFIFHDDLFPQGNKCHEADVTMSEIIFEFSCDFGDDKIIECGVQIMREEVEGSNIRELDSHETESSSSEVDSHETESGSNCLKLDKESRRGIIQQSVGMYKWLPGKNIPADFTHKATGRSITIPLAPGTLSASSRFKASILILPVEYAGLRTISCSIRSKGGVTVHSYEFEYLSLSFRSKHLFIFHGDLFPQGNKCHEVDVTMSEIIFEFSFNVGNAKISECGVQIMTEEAEGSSIRELDNYETESSSSEVDSHETESSSSEVDSHETESSSSEVDSHETESSSSEVDSHETESSSSEVDSHETESSSSEDGNGDENIKTSKQTGFRSWLRKFFCLEEKKMNTTEGILMESHETKPVFCTLLHHLRKVGDREFRQDTDSPEIKTKSTQGDHTVPGCWSSALCCEHKKAKPLKEG